MRKRLANQHAQVGVPEKFKPPRDVTVPTIRAVACPVCGADVGERCRKADGSQQNNTHRDRRRAAVRLRNEQGESSLRRPAEPATAEDRAAVRLDSLPPVLFRGRPIEQVGTATAKPSGGGKGVRAWGNCETCGVVVSGERRFCGRCLAHRLSRRHA